MQIDGREWGSGHQAAPERRYARGVDERGQHSAVYRPACLHELGPVRRNNAAVAGSGLCDADANEVDEERIIGLAVARPALGNVVRQRLELGWVWKAHRAEGSFTRVIDSFPRQHARTQRFSLGVPRNLSVTSSGRVLFLRSRGGEDPTNCLWAIEPDSGDERLVVDPLVLLDPAAEVDLPAAERVRRERAREGAAGIVSYALDGSGDSATFALAGRGFRVDIATGVAVELATDGSVFDPRPEPSGHRVAYVSGAELRIVATDAADSLVMGETGETISWGSAEFIAAEEMRRSRGFWWAPDGTQLVAARVDVDPVAIWHIADPAHPERAPHPNRYPAAGTADAEVTLHLVDPLGVDAATEIGWDRSALPYVVDVDWSDVSGLTVVAQSRDQRRMDVMSVDTSSGATRVERSLTEPDWIEIVPGTPRWANGRLVTIQETAQATSSTRSLLVDDQIVSPADQWVRSLVHGADGVMIYTASTNPTEVQIWRATESNGDWSVEALSTNPGMHSAVGDASTLVVQSADLANPSETNIVRASGEVVGITSLAATPLLTPNVELFEAGERGIATAVLFPAGSGPDDEALPVLLDPYGGPHAQRVLASRNAYLASQWFADQGFVVIVADGRGTPGRGNGWERAVRGDLAQPVLDDQVAALEATAERHPGRLDLDRVAVRGWSFGGYLAALALLRRPDVFHTAIAGAPVTDWRLYDTHYTERYLGHPDEEPENYERTSLINEAHLLERPLMLIHGLADDNVVAAHTLQFSTALLEAGRPHEVLPLSGVTHMTPQEVVAENLLLLQVDFLRRSLDLS